MEYEVGKKFEELDAVLEHILGALEEKGIIPKREEAEKKHD